MDLPWKADLVRYWERLGGQVGDRAEAVAVPTNAGNIHVRTLRIRPAVVQSIVPNDLNIVLQRLESVPDERFDVIVATDVLVYYDVFDQSLALVNIAKMLRPGGLFLTNNRLFELPGIPMVGVGTTDTVHFTAPAGDIRDQVVWYQRQ
jgi:hypothetical protein